MRNRQYTVFIVVGLGDYTGAAKMAHLYGRAFRKAGWKVNFVVGDVPSGSTTILKDQLLHEGFTSVQVSGFFQLLCPNLVTLLTKLLSDGKADLAVSFVQVDLKVVGPACRRAGVPCIVSDQTVHRFYGPRILRALKEWAFAREMRLATAVIATSESVAQEAVSRFGCSAERLFTVPNGIVTNDYGAPAAYSPACNDRQGMLRLLNVGRLDPQKGQLLLVEAASAVMSKRPQVTLSLAGGVTPQHAQSLAYSETLMSAIVDSGFKDRISLLGWQSRVAELCARHDAYIHSALWEGPPLPLAVLEAMACGLPVVITDCAGWPDGFVDGVHGWVVPAGNVEALASAIGRMCRLSAGERREMGEACRRLVVERYDVAATGKKFVEICEEVVARSVAR